MSEITINNPLYVEYLKFLHSANFQLVKSRNSETQKTLKCKWNIINCYYVNKQNILIWWFADTFAIIAQMYEHDSPEVISWFYYRHIIFHLTAFSAKLNQFNLCSIFECSCWCTQRKFVFLKNVPSVDTAGRKSWPAQQFLVSLAFRL